MHNLQLVAEYPVGHPMRGPAFGERLDPATIGIGLLGSLLASSITGQSSPGVTQTGAAPPAVTAPTVMPAPDDEAAKAAKRKAIAGLSQRSGRQSTILDTGPVSNDLLG